MNRTLKRLAAAEIQRYKGWTARACGLNPDEQAVLLLVAALFVLGLLVRAFFV